MGISCERYDPKTGYTVCRFCGEEWSCLAPAPRDHSLFKCLSKLLGRIEDLEAQLAAMQQGYTPEDE